MNWACPECETENNEEIVRCVCGYEFAEPPKIYGRYQGAFIVLLLLVFLWIFLAAIEDLILKNR